MVSNFLRLCVAPGAHVLRPEQTAEPEGFGDRMMDRVREAFCGLHGHDHVLQLEPDRLFLKCVSCGHESPGWALHRSPPMVVAKPDRRRQSLARPRPISDRRIA